MSEPLQQLKKPPYFMLAILFFGAFVSFLNNSLMNVALPTIMGDFGMTDYSTVQWLTTGYMLVSGVLIPVSAFLLTRFTNRALFITAMTLFTLGTGIAAIAPNFGVLLTGRMIQAAGSSVMSPLLMNVMLISFPREKRGAAMGVFGLVMITAPALGPTLSGYIVEYYDWRVLFEMILPFSIIALVLAIFKLQNVMPTKKATLDYLSVVLSTLGFGSLLYGFSSVSTSADGWKDSIVITTIAAGVVLIVLFVLRQLRSGQPLLNLSVYKYPMFALGNVISVVNSAALFAGMILTPAYMQTVKGISPLDSGLMMLPGALVMGVMSPITGKLFDKFGPRVLGIIGIGITTIATYQMTFFELDTSNLHIVLVYSVRMFGISMVMMPIMTNGLNQLPTRLNPHGTAVNNTIQQVAGAIGTAIFVSIMNSHTAQSITEQLDGIDPTTLAADQMALIKRTGMLEGIQYTFLIATFTTLVAFILTFFVKRVDVSKDALAKIEGDNATS
ncbi:MAG: DHA2 family efflux MFS transporter permease subunit [Candidatus Pristimantibacillus lignocellulolyticus]|uniref:DHA2 family efflux MFS transporter permease subunit n=1 Tax=Candidatus Pristimantibacillus lignocellulolyticus TaxID=2994561 RepID=A0A9J6ZFR3_9BACL|nr:MAG: DHA2 family efflux MFS transporter permease subunit [Candidatus Pristimantibacillus lignocellulolyticus]